MEGVGFRVSGTLPVLIALTLQGSLALKSGLVLLARPTEELLCQERKLSDLGVPRRIALSPKDSVYKCSMNLGPEYLLYRLIDLLGTLNSLPSWQGGLRCRHGMNTSKHCVGMVAA